MLHATPFLLFDGNCAEAMTFYHDALGGDLTLTKLADTPMKDMFPQEKWERLINAHLKSGDIEISATDWMASPQYEPEQGNTTAIFVIGEGYDELETIFGKLSEGIDKESQGSRFQELHELPFGTYGQFTDKYGVHWIFKGDKKEP
ncbi:MAG TPA: VOC family protein [Candidatus Saccharimonadales bacterium]|nr:VOC family protein [Candidatus Saccharimonadales bacterium]